MGKIKCLLCPKTCALEEGEIGDCGARKNIQRKIHLLTYGKPCSLALDPMEKKPLYHFYPGTPILSLGMAGCNLHCKNCQNSSISQVQAHTVATQNVVPEHLPEIMMQNNVFSVAYTYTEPLVSYEYVKDCSIQVAENNGKNVLVTAGYINPKPLKELLPFIHGINLDIKSMSPEFYKENCSITLKPVLETAKNIRKFPVHLEITNLVIPTLNDKDKDFLALIQFVKDYLGAETPLHFSAFFPTYKRQNLNATSPETLDKACTLAKEQGLKHVYAGNLRTHAAETFCPSCNTLLIQRFGYTIHANNLIKNLCPHCGTKLYGSYI